MIQREEIDSVGIQFPPRPFVFFHDKNISNFLRFHDVMVGVSILGLGSINTVTYMICRIMQYIFKCGNWILL